MSNELARRAVACKHWRWMPGMRAIDSEGQAARVVQACGAAVLEDVGGAAYPMPSTPPDLTDPATLGCLLALVREAWGDPYVYVLSCANDWFTVCSPAAEGGKWLRHPPIDGSTESEALVAALEAVEGREVKDE